MRPEEAPKHWEVFIKTPKAEDHHILHATKETEEQGFYFQNRSTIGWISKRLEQMVEMCGVPTSKVDLIDQLAEKLPLQSKE
jgi:hypothetical protein